ncbi:MAG: DUF2179 domain-containing protein [Kiritimatiellia bacterium]
MLLSSIPPETWALIIIPLAIMLARICDVTLGTVRIIFVARGMKAIAPLLGFFEVLIWLIAIGQIMQNLTSWINYVAYAAGFAIGNYIGILVEERLAVGILAVRIITQTEATTLIQELRKHNIGTTSIDARGMQGTVSLIFIIIERQHLPIVRELVQKHNPKAFVSINDIRSVQEGYFPKRSPNSGVFMRLLNTSLKRK